MQDNVEFEKDIVSRDKRNSYHFSTVRLVLKEISRRKYPILNMKVDTDKLVDNAIVTVNKEDKQLFIRFRSFLGEELRLNINVVNSVSEIKSALLIVARPPMVKDLGKEQDTRNWVIITPEQCKEILKNSDRHKSKFQNYQSSMEIITKPNQRMCFDDIFKKSI